MLANGRVIATYQDSPVTDYYNKQHPGQFVVGGSVSIVMLLKFLKWEDQ